MKKLRIILLFSFIILIFFNIYRINRKEKYDLNTSLVKGVVKDYNIDGDKLNVVIGKYKINYYFKSEIEKTEFNISIGDIFEFKGESLIPKDNTNFKAFNYRLYLKSKKIDYVFNASEYSKIKENENIFYKIKNWIRVRIEKSNSSVYLNLFLMGSKQELDENINTTYSNNGISHLFAISGMHISLLSTLILFLLNKISKSKVFNNIIISLFLVLFSFITSFSPSVIRATLMTISLMFLKKIKPIYIILIVFIIMFSYNPFYIYNIGFLYSFIVSFSLILFSSKIGGKNYIFKIFKTSLIAFISGIPISIINFHEINLISPFLNILFVPLISFIVFPLSLITFILPILSPLFNLSIYVLEKISLFFSNITCFKLILKDINIIGIIIYYLVIIIVINKNKFKYYLMFILLLFIHSNINYLNRYPIITMIDVGQGDSILIELPHNKGNLLIDTGGSISYEVEKWRKRKNNYSIAKSTIIPYLKSQGIKKIDYLVFSHGDADHIGEGENLVNNFKVKHVFLNSGSDGSLEISLKEVLNDKKIYYLNISKYSLNIHNYIFNFINDIDISNENEDSLVIDTYLSGKHILLMGDAGSETEKYLIDNYDLKNVDILKVGHHGSKYSSSQEFLKLIKPKYSLISVSLNNKYNHPHMETLNRLTDVESVIYKTSINGMIKIIIKDDLEIYTCL